MITDEYKQMLQGEHEKRSDKKWGTTGARNFGDYVKRFLEQRRGQIKSVLDFGAGQCSLEKYVKDNAIDVRVHWVNYDPGIPGIDEIPERKFDLIVSSDVLEHVEPAQIGDVVKWMKEHAEKAMFHHIACDPAGLILPDGRNAHLICQKLDWWERRFADDKWDVMYKADAWVKKRGILRNHCHLQLDRRGS